MSFSPLTTLASALMIGSSNIFSIGNAARASFGTGTDISGTVRVEGGSVEVSLDLSNFNTSLLPNGSSCYTNGLKYHIHEYWTYINDTNDKLKDGCGSEYTGDHWDPWTGCSTSTGNPYCLSENVTISCVPGSVVWSENGKLGYSCDSTNYTENPYVCEVGDWSGKYGILSVTDDMKLTATSSSAFEVAGTDLDGKSIVFHCADEKSSRAFCAPFTDTDVDTSTNRVTQSKSTSKTAKFTQLRDSSITLTKDNKYKVQFDIEGLAIPENCGNLLYRVYNGKVTHTNVINETDSIRRRLLQTESTSTTIMPSTSMKGGSTMTPTNPMTTEEEFTSTMMETTSSSVINCSALVSSFYDPTVSCADGSEYVNDYCATSNLKCGDVGYAYICNDTSDHYGCAPGDLSGKYGIIKRVNSTDTSFTFSGFDELMISLDLLDGKYAVLQCTNDVNTILACAEFTDSSSSSSSSSNGAAWWVWLIVVIAVILLIAGIVWLVKYCKGDDGKYTRIQKE